MNDTTASTANNAIVISDDVQVVQPSDNTVVISNSLPLNTAVVEPTSTTYSRPVTNEHVDSSTEEDEDNAVRQTVVDRVQRIKLTEGADDDDFQPVKKRKIQESDDIEVDEGQLCSICLEPWSNSGFHRIASLKCGHLFGQSCVEKWLKGSGGKCPQCNAKAKRADIRLIYAKTISVVDTTERDRALKELEEEKSKSLSLQKDEAHAVLQYQLAQAECSKLQHKISELEKQLSSFNEGVAITSHDPADGSSGPAIPVVSSDGKYFHLKNFEISSQGGARVMAYDSTAGMLVASKPSPNQLFRGFGLVKISGLELKVHEYIGIHQANLRDAAFSPNHGSQSIVLTVGMDKSAKLTSLLSNSTVQSYEMPGPTWSCCWNQNNSNYFYCGVQNGSVIVCDIRNTSSHVACMKQERSLCPITSLCHISQSRASNLGCEGVLAGTLEGAVFWERKSENYTSHGLAALQGSSCTSVSFEPLTRHCLTSFRPSVRQPHCQHIMSQLYSTVTEAGDNAVNCRIVQHFDGGQNCKLLSRSSLFIKPNGDQIGALLAAYGDEATHSVHIWDINTVAKLQQINIQPDAVLDIKPFGINSSHYLTLLTEKQLQIHRWTPD